MTSRRSYVIVTILVFAAFSFMRCGESEIIVPEKDMPTRVIAGGSTTVPFRTSDGFSTPAPNLSPSDLDRHLNGDADFEAKFVSAPAPVNPGLGSIFNNSSCIACHPGDGRAAFPEDIRLPNGLLVRTSIGGEEPDGEPVAVPAFGTQIQNRSIHGVAPEASYRIAFETHTENLADGTVVELRKPVLQIIETYAPMPSDALFSIRLGPPVVGLGLLEAIPEQTILSYQDIDDKDKDGISGKANYVMNPYTQKRELGRFGWKANTSTLRVQVAAAYAEDIGITSYIFPQEACYGQSNCSDIEAPEVSQQVLDDVVFYTQTLAVPAPVDVDKPEIIEGFRVFKAIGCNKCHIPEMKTGASPIKALSDQTFYPFTDMLVHDMGDGLADGRSDFMADGNEWKTRPLWVIGLTLLINGHTDFLHDGRARNITEAIMWHGGEAQSAKQSFANLSTVDRERLLAFINSL